VLSVVGSGWIRNFKEVLILEGLSNYSREMPKRINMLLTKFTITIISIVYLCHTNRLMIFLVLLLFVSCAVGLLFMEISH